MARREEPFTVGVEEEYQLVDAETLALRPRADRVLPLAHELLGEEVTGELNLSQVEIGTPVCDTLDDVRAELRRLRRGVAEAASRKGSAIAAMGTHPFTEWLGQAITPADRYQRLEDEYQQLAREQLVCGCHVHVCVQDDEVAIAVLDRLRPWLAPLLALTANSPYWQAVDTGYASFRTAVFDRWPTTGTPNVLGSRAAYDRLVEDLVATGAVPDASFLYWDVRPSTRFSTLEFRIADVCLTVDEAVMLAGLARSLTRTCYRLAVEDVPVDHARPELLSAARWRAARYGLDGELVDAAACRSRPAPDVIAGLLDFLRPDLEDAGEWDEVSALVGTVVREGNGAARQRAAFARAGDLGAVVGLAVASTTGEV